MKHYADSLGADPQRWWFLTGRKDSLYHLARTGYMLDDPKNNALNINEQFLHTQFVALVDKGGRVRKIYDGLKQEELDELEKDIAALLKEITTLEDQKLDMISKVQSTAFDIETLKSENDRHIEQIAKHEQQEEKIEKEEKS